MPESTTDLYSASAATIRQPPRGFFPSLRFLGPGFILSASIVGSGELIATTTLGAKAGFAAFWVILLSCLVKVAIQLEFGKQAILTGQTPMKSFNQIPGPRIAKGGWCMWAIFLCTALKVIQVGGMLGGTAIVMTMLFPAIGIVTWAAIIALAAFLLIYKGLYNLIEKGSLIMIAAFTIMTLISLVAINYTGDAITLSEIASGFHFNMPASLVIIAIAAFGITGVGSDEIIAYGYWCLEKGYAAYTGPRTDTDEWRYRARGWIRVMYLDAAFAMIIYTAVTAAFYLLGAAVLHRRGIAPEGNDVIETVALLYTQTLGKGVRTAYLVGAFFVLFSSVFATLAAWTRLFSDLFGELGWINFLDSRQRKKIIAILSWVFPLCWLLTFMYIKLPVFMIMFGGVVGSVMLLVCVYAAIFFRNRRQKIYRASKTYEFSFWLSVVAIFMVAVSGLMQLLSANA